MCIRSVSRVDPDENVFMKKIKRMGCLVVLGIGLCGWLVFHFGGGGADGEGEEAPQTGIEGAFQRTMAGAREAIEREADEAVGAMKDAARAKADELKMRARTRAEEMKAEARVAIQAKAQELTEDAKAAVTAKARELADDLTKSVESSADGGLKKMGAGIKRKIEELTESFRGSKVTEWEADELKAMLQDLVSGRDDEALEKLNQLNQKELNPERSEKYDGLIDDVAAFAAERNGG